MARSIVETGGGSPLGIAIREIRSRNNWSQQKLAERCGTSKGYLSQIENGVYPNPSDKLVICFAEQGGEDPQHFLELKQQHLVAPQEFVVFRAEDLRAQLDRIEKNQGLLLQRVDSLLQRFPQPDSMRPENV